MAQDDYNSSIDRSDPAYWDFYYDPRYCGPSREAYVGRMVSQNTPEPREEIPPREYRYVSEEERQKAFEEWIEGDEDGLDTPSHT